MTVDKIIAKIRANAAASAAALEREGEAEAESIRQQAILAAEAEYRQCCSAAAREGNLIADRVRSAAEMEARRMVSEARSTIISDCLDQARSQCPVISRSPEYPTIFRQLLEEGIREIGRNDLLIVVHLRDTSLAESSAADIPGKQYRIVPAPNGQIPTGGMIIRSAAGDRSVNQTFETRLRRETPGLISEVSQILFDQQ